MENRFSMVVRMVVALIASVFMAQAFVVHAANNKPQQARKSVAKAVANVKAANVSKVAKAAKAAPNRGTYHVQRVALRQPARGHRYVAPAPPPPEVFNPELLEVHSTAALVINANDGSVIHEKNINAAVPIASITKLMTAMVVLDAKLPLDELIMLNEDDLDTIKGTGSRLSLGTMLTRDEMLRLALMSSENRAASALGRSYPGGLAAFVREMNLKALSLEMMRTSFVDSTGLSAGNMSSALDLAKMVKAAYQYPLIRQYSTGNGYQVQALNGRMLDFRNTNSLIVSPDWEINLSKTGYIREAGRCVVMHTTIANSPYVVVLLDSFGRLSRVGDANRIKKWIEYHHSARTIG